MNQLNPDPQGGESNMTDEQILPTRDAVEKSLGAHDYPAKAIKHHLSLLTEGERRILFRAVLEAAEGATTQPTPASAPAMPTGIAPGNDDTAERKLLVAAYNALRSYQFGNGCPDLAAQTANAIGFYFSGGKP